VAILPNQNHLPVISHRDDGNGTRMDNDFTDAFAPIGQPHTVTAQLQQAPFKKRLTVNEPFPQPKPPPMGKG
jgi:hypothetical protein